MSKTGKLSLYDYCIQNNRIQVLQEWHPVKNEGLSPADVSFGSRTQAWWLCGKGHEWQAAVFSRANGSGCPVCSGIKTLEGENDLASLYPELAAEWNSERNEGLSPTQFTAGSHKKIWWKCENGHEWQASICSRTHGSGCPVCSGRKALAGENDFASLYPELAAQWHPTKNHGISPSDVTAHSTRKIWWICDKGHEWQTQVAYRAKGNGCPICAGRQVLPGYNDFASAYPEMARQWVIEKNLPVKPNEITAQSNIRAWWRCDKGHEWQAKVSARVTHGSGCPYCSGRRVLAGFNDLATVYPKIAAQWNTERNGELTPAMVTPGSSKKVWWCCSHGHEWQALIYSRTSPRKNGCPYCSGKYRESHKYGTGCITEVQIAVSDKINLLNPITK